MKGNDSNGLFIITSPCRHFRIVSHLSYWSSTMSRCPSRRDQLKDLLLISALVELKQVVTILQISRVRNISSSSLQVHLGFSKHRVHLAIKKFGSTQAAENWGFRKSYPNCGYSPTESHSVTQCFLFKSLLVSQCLEVTGRFAKTDCIVY